MWRFCPSLKSLACSFAECQALPNGRKKAFGLEAFRFFWSSNVGERTRASLHLIELSTASQGLRTRDFVSIFKFIANNDPLFALATWKTAREKNIQLDGKCFLLTFEALCGGGYLKEAVNMLGEDPEIHPSLPSYNHLLRTCIQMNSLIVANECLNLMEQQCMGKNTETYSILLERAVMQKDLQTTRQIWQQYIRNHGLSLITLQKFVRSFTMLRDLESAYLALQHIVALSLQLKFYTAKYAENSWLVDTTVEIPIPFLDEFSQIQKPAAELKKSGPMSYFSTQPTNQPLKKLLRSSFNDVIYACSDSRNDLLAEGLVLQMKNLGLAPSLGTYDGLIKALVSVRSFHHGIEVLKIIKQNGLRPYNSTLAALSASCSRGLQLDLAQMFLFQISKYFRIYPFNLFLKACDTMGQPDRALHGLFKMKHLGIKPNIRTYELLFSLFANVNAPYEKGNRISQDVALKRINAIEMDMKRHGIQHNHHTIKNLLKALGMEGMLEKMAQRLEVAERQFLYTTDHEVIDVYNTALHMLVEANMCGKAIEVFNRMASCGISPNATTYGIMIDCCGIMTCSHSAYALISQMIRHGYCLNSVILTAAIKGLKRHGDFAEALKLVNSAGIQPDVVLYNEILLAAVIKKRLDVIEMILERMHREKIQPDSKTCTLVFNAYVYMGFLNTAMEALQVLCMRMLSEDDDIREEYRLQYENLIMDEEEPESRMLEIFDDSPNISIGLLCLRWCAILMASPVSWTPNQTQWAKELSNHYASTCLNLNLTRS